MVIMLLGHILAVCIGLSLGLIGGGGSILAVPILVYVMDIPSKVAIAMSLLIVGFVSLLGVIPHWFQGNVNLRVAALFTPAGMLGAYLGARLASLPVVSDRFQLLCFALVMIVASVLMIVKSSEQLNDPNSDLLKESLEANHSKHSLWMIPVEGVSVGMLTGFVGVGGGFLIIPALVLVGGIPMKQAVGTSLLIIAAKSAAGFLGYLNQVEIDWSLSFTFAVAASFGTLLGASIAPFVDGKHLQKGFGYFVLAVAVFVLLNR